MGAIVVTDAALAGVRLLARRPLAALTWALIYVLFIAAIVFVFGGTLLAAFASIARSGGKPSVAAVLSLIAGVLAFYVLFLVGLLVVGAIVSCAVIRAVLEPAASSFAYLRLGRQEMRMALLSLCKGLLMFVVSFVLAIPLVILVAIFASRSIAEMTALRLGGQLLINGLIYWIYLRLSMAAPMTFDERRFRLFESWTLTAGHVWRLLLVGLLVLAMVIGVYLLLGVIGFAAGAAMWRDVPGLTNPTAFFRRPPGVWLPAIAPLLALGSALGFVLAAVLTPLVIAPWARVYRQLKPDEEIAANFA